MRVLNKAAVTRTAFPDRPDPCDSWPIATLLQLPQSDNCHKDRGPTVNKAIIVSRQVGTRYPTTNQRNTKTIVIMMIMIIVIIIIIINIIMSMVYQTPQADPNMQGGTTRPTPRHSAGRGATTKAHTRTTPHHQGEGKQPTTTPHHTTPQGGEGSNPQPHHTTGGGGNHWVGDHITHIYIYALGSGAPTPGPRPNRNEPTPEGGMTMENDPSQCFFTGAENRIRAGTGAPFARRKEQHHILYGNEHVTMTLLLTSGSNHTISL